MGTHLYQRVALSGANPDEALFTQLDFIATKVPIETELTLLGYLAW